MIRDRYLLSVTSVHLSILQHGTTQLPLDGFFVFLKNLSRRYKFIKNLTNITGTLHEDRRTFILIPRWILLCSMACFRKSCRLWDNVEKYGRTGQSTDGNVIRRKRFACWICKATDTHSEYVILLFHDNDGYGNAPQYYVCTCTVWFSLTPVYLLIVGLEGYCSNWSQWHTLGRTPWTRDRPVTEASAWTTHNIHTVKIHGPGGVSACQANCALLSRSWMQYNTGSLG